MKPAVVDRELETTLDGEVIPLSLDETSIVHLMNVYIDLYEDAERAILREYATNAYDAHVEAGNPDPIEIELPGPLTPTLVIRDRGIGLSLGDIRDIYAKYGASTKRGTNDLTGLLGLGCKSGLTYADQFVVSAVKHGVKTVVSVSRDSTGAGSMTVVTHEQSDEPNGVEITIPTKREHGFREKAAELFQYWPKGSVLVNGKAPERFETRLKARRVTDSLYLVPKESYRDKRNMVVMGNVPYPVSSSDWGIDIGHNHSLIAFLPMGAVEFPPDRESLRDTPHTKASLHQAGRELAANLIAAAQADIDAAPTRHEALRVVVGWDDDLPSGMRPASWTYRGEEVPVELRAPARQWVPPGSVGGASAPYYPRVTIVPQNNHRKISAHDNQEVIRRSQAAKALWFHGFEINFTANQRRRLDKWHEDVHPDLPEPAYWILLGDHPDTTWIDPERVFDWAEVRAVKLPRLQSTASAYAARSYRLLGSYRALQPGDARPYDLLAEHIDASRPVYYYAATERTSNWERSRFQRAEPTINAIRLFDPRCTIVLLPETRVNRLCEQFPHAQEISAAVETKFNRWWKRLSDDTRNALAIAQSGERADLRTLRASQLEDPELAEAVRLAKLDIRGVHAKLQAFTTLGKRLELPSFRTPLRHYPLFNPHADRKHTILYLNAAYRAFRRKDP